MRYAQPDKQNFKVLELGCGAGANIPFFESLGTEYFAVDGSKTIVEGLKQKFSKFEKNITVADFTEEIPFQTNFDLIVDRTSVTHNNLRGIKQCLKLTYDKLKDGGKFVGIGWLSTLHSEFENGITNDDPFTKSDYTNGMFTGVGRVHFSDKNHLLELFHNFDILILEHKIVKTEIPDENKIFASWNIVARKK